MAMLKLMTPKFRVSFPNVFEAKKINNEGKAKYSLTMLFNLAEIMKNPDEKKKWEAMLAAVKQIATENWPKGIPEKMQNPFRKGEEKEQYQGYGPGVIFVVASTLTRPGVVDEKVVPIVDREQFYAGCYARAMVNPYAWTFMGKNGVSFGLQNVQKIADGDPFGGRSNAEDDFEAVEGGVTDAGSVDNASALFG